MAFYSICYHYNNLVSNIHYECSFHASPFFKDIPGDILKCVRVAYTWDTTEYTPTLTGIPPHVLMMSEMEIIRRKFDNLQKGIKSDTNKILEKGVWVVMSFTLIPSSLLLNNQTKRCSASWRM